MHNPGVSQNRYAHCRLPFITIYLFPVKREAHCRFIDESLRGTKSERAMCLQLSMGQAT